MIWNPFKKKKPAVNLPVESNNKVDNEANQESQSQPKPKSGLGGGFAMNMMQKIAMKKMAKMSPQEQAKMMQDMLKPENKGKLLEVLEYMKKSGQVSEEQYQAAKKRLGV